MRNLIWVLLTVFSATVVGCGKKAPLAPPTPVAAPGGETAGKATKPVESTSTVKEAVSAKKATPPDNSKLVAAIAELAPLADRYVDLYVRLAKNQQVPKSLAEVSRSVDAAEERCVEAARAYTGDPLTVEWKDPKGRVFDIARLDAAISLCRGADRLVSAVAELQGLRAAESYGRSFDGAFAGSPGYTAGGSGVDTSAAEAEFYAARAAFARDLEVYNRTYGDR